MIVWKFSRTYAPIQHTISNESMVRRLKLSCLVRPRMSVNFLNWSGMSGWCSETQRYCFQKIRWSLGNTWDQVLTLDRIWLLRF